MSSGNSISVIKVFIELLDIITQEIEIKFQSLRKKQY